MNDNTKRIVIVLSILLVIVIVIIVVMLLKPKKENKVIIDRTVDNIDISINTDDGDEKINWGDYKNEDIKLTKSMDITKGGIYTLSGSIDGYVKVNTNDNVKLVLDNVSIKNSNGPAIYIENANNVVIELKDGTVNEIEDGKKYSGYDEDVNGCLFSKDDLIIQGDGALNIIGNYKDGIVSKDDLKIINGNILVKAVDDGIRGKDSVYIVDGNFKIEADGDGIKSTNDTDDKKGFIKIENGKFDIKSNLDGIQAETKILIENGEFDIVTNEGSSNSSSTNENWGDFGKGGMRPGMNPGMRPGMNQNNSNVESAKGIKALDNLVILNGKFKIDSSDDAIHSNNYLGIKNGIFDISSGDDGIHADTESIIDNGNISITKSYEGIESAKIVINGGNIELISSDDGLNICGGMDSSPMGRPGANNYNDGVERTLTINGGNIKINANGDGIDINGSGYINGGYIVVEGPSDNGNGALDYDKELVVNGGTLIASGSSGMYQGVSDNSKQYAVNIAFNTTINAKEVIIEDSKGIQIIKHSSSKSYNALVLSSDRFKKGETYTIKVDGSKYDTFKISNIITNVGNVTSNGGMHGGRPNDMSGGKPERPSRV